ncbi:MAG: alpha/beta hydrolase [Actinomycetota bacterium]|nr:alpha/beta hydrolase [Actinomycetota bacterium]
MPTVAAGPAELYYEVRGSGPPLLFIMGATGDAGHFERIVDRFADEFTCVTYDRRGNSRSPRPRDWSTTSVEEQADDAAALLGALALGPAAVFGNSSGAIYALGLLTRHPEAVRGAILHEPPLISVLERPAEVQAALGAVVGESMAAGGPPAALEAFWRFAAGDGNWEALEPGLRDRMLDNAETFFGVELGTFESYRPDDATLAAVAVPVQVLVSEQSAPFYPEIARWLAQRLGVEVSETPGTHTPYHDHPDELAQTIRPFLTSVSGR